jgi:hypothetical protein
MFLTPMREQGIVGSLTRLSQAFQFSPSQLEIASDLPLKLSLSSRVEADCVLIRAE